MEDKPFIYCSACHGSIMDDKWVRNPDGSVVCLECVHSNQVGHATSTKSAVSKKAWIIGATLAGVALSAAIVFHIHRLRERKRLETQAVQRVWTVRNFRSGGVVSDRMLASACLLRSDMIPGTASVNLRAIKRMQSLYPLVLITLLEVDRIEISEKEARLLLTLPEQETRTEVRRIVKHCAGKNPTRYRGAMDAEGPTFTRNRLLLGMLVALGEIRYKLRNARNTYYYAMEVIPTEERRAEDKKFEVDLRETGIEKMGEFLRSGGLAPPADDIGALLNAKDDDLRDQIERHIENWISRGLLRQKASGLVAGKA